MAPRFPNRAFLSCKLNLEPTDPTSSIFPILSFCPIGLLPTLTVCHKLNKKDTFIPFQDFKLAKNKKYKWDEIFKVAQYLM